MMINKSRLVEALRRRGQNARADWVDKELPDDVDTDRNASLLATLRLDPADLAEDVGPSSESLGSGP